MRFAFLCTFLRLFYLDSLPAFAELLRLLNVTLRICRQTWNSPPLAIPLGGRIFQPIRRWPPKSTMALVAFGDFTLLSGSRIFFLGFLFGLLVDFKLHVFSCPTLILSILSLSILALSKLGLWAFRVTISFILRFSVLRLSANFSS